MSFGHVFRPPGLRPGSRAARVLCATAAAVALAVAAAAEPAHMSTAADLAASQNASGGSGSAPRGFRVELDLPSEPLPLVSALDPLADIVAVNGDRFILLVLDESADSMAVPYELMSISLTTRGDASATWLPDGSLRLLSASGSYTLSVRSASPWVSTEQHGTLALSVQDGFVVHASASGRFADKALPELGSYAPEWNALALLKEDVTVDVTDAPVIPGATLSIVEHTILRRAVAFDDGPEPVAFDTQPAYVGLLDTSDGRGLVGPSDPDAVPDASRFDLGRWTSTGYSGGGAGSLR